MEGINHNREFRSFIRFQLFARKVVSEGCVVLPFRAEQVRRQLEFPTLDDVGCRTP